jgi:SAM-dependent methyltransferase
MGSGETDARRGGSPPARGYIDWGHASAGAGCTWRYVLPPVLDFCAPYPPPARVLDVGCGNGYLAGQLLNRGYSVVGIDLSPSGIQIARAPRLSQGSFRGLGGGRARVGEPE